MKLWKDFYGEDYKIEYNPEDEAREKNLKVKKERQEAAISSTLQITKNYLKFLPSRQINFISREFPDNFD